MERYKNKINKKIGKNLKSFSKIIYFILLLYYM